MCPYCGEWHEWKLSHELGYYNHSSYKAQLKCEKQHPNCNVRATYIYFFNGYCYYKTTPTCNRGYLDICDKILIEDIDESSKEPRVTFDVQFTARWNVSRSECSDCDGRDGCLMCKLGDENNSQCMKIPFGFEFEEDDYMRYSEAARRLVKERVKAAQRENARKMETTQPKGKEETTMANNILNMNMEFGPNQDENIASTLMGIAVKNGDSWRIYDKQKKEITDIGDMNLGNLPIFILPTTKLAEGDLIKDGDEYYFVIKVQKGITQTLCAKTGEMKTVIPIKNILGLSCYSKVIALSDKLNMSDDFDVEELAIMSTMCGQNAGDNGQMNQLLPLMFFKDKLGKNDDTVKMIMLSSMMAKPAEDGASTSGTAAMNQWLPLLLMKDRNKEGENGEKSDLMDIVLMASMMGNNMDGNNNFLMGYLMIDMLNKKKKEEKPSEATD